MKLRSFFAVALLLPTLCLAEDRAVFATPTRARSALIGAIDSHNPDALVRLFGTGASDLVHSGDPTYDTLLAGRMSAAAAKNCTISQRDSQTVFFNLGPNHWRMPIPLVKRNDGWVFDADRGRTQVLQNRERRSGANVVNVCKEFVKAQLKYVQNDYNGDGVREYARKFLSTPDKRDGLYWPTQGPGETSPLWPLVAKAQSQGYFADLIKGGQPYLGYHYAILTKQGPNAPGGARDYLVDNHLVGGFALIAWPAKYGASGRETYIVNQSGRVLQKDLGPDTAKLVKQITSYNPDRSWTPAAPYY